MTTTRPVGPASQQWFDRTLLTDSTRCPACTVPLEGPLCGTCGLSLSGPRGSALWDVSRRVEGLLEHRDALLATMRLPVAAHRPEPEPRVSPAVAPSPVPVPVPIPIPRSVYAPPADIRSPAAPYPAPASPARQASTAPRTAAPPVRTAPGSPWPATTPRASWPLQNVLLGLGALLLAGASIVFLAFTWGVMPLGLRATVIAVITAALFGAATFSARKGLAASADALAALGSLLVILDAWALHATGLVTRPDGPAFAALAALGCAVVLVALGTSLRLDVPRAVGWVLLPVAPLLLSTDGPSVSVGTLLVLLSVALCGVHLSRFCERRAAAVLRVLALVLVCLAVFLTVLVLILDGPFAAAGVLCLVAAISHGWSWFLPSAPVVWRVVAGSTQTLTVVCLALGLSGDVLSASSLWVALLGALAGAVSVSLVGRLVPRLGERAPTAGWLIFFATTVLPAQGVVLLTLATVFTATSDPDRPLLWACLIGLVVALGGSFVHGVLGRTQPQGATVLAPTTGASSPPAPGLMAVPTGPALRVAPWFAALILLGSALVLGGSLPLVVVWWLVLPLALLVAVDRRLPRGWSSALRASCLTSVGLAIVLSTVLAAGVSTSITPRAGALLLAASLLTLMVVLLVARSWVESSTSPARPAQRSRADLLLAALVAGAAGAGSALGAATGEIGAAWPGAALPLVLLALGLLAVADRSGVDATGHVRMLSRRLAAMDLQSVLVATAAVSAVSLVASASSPGGWIIETPVASAPPGWVAVLVLSTAALLALLAGVLALGGQRLVPAGAVITCAAATPALAVLAVLTVGPLVAGVSIEWEVISLVVLAFFPVVAATRGADAARVRAAMETSAAALGLLALLLVAVLRTADVLAVALVLAAAATAAWAVMPARGRAWWAALALATCASWTALGSGGVGTVEAYSAPCAVVIALLGTWNVRRGRPSGRLQVLAGSAVLLLPTALLAPTTSQWRSLAVVAALVLVAAGVLVAGELRARTGRETVGPPGHTRAPGLTAWFILLGLGVAVLGVAGRAVTLAAAWSAVHGRGTTDHAERARTLLADTTAQPGVWIPLAALAVCGFSLLLVRAWPWSASAGPRSWTAGLTALVLTVPAWTLVAGGSLGDVGATWTVLALIMLWGIVALLGTPPGLPHVGSRAEFLQRAVPPLAVAYVVALGLASATDVPADVLFTLVGIFVAVVAVRAAVVEPRVRTWGTVGYGVFATVAPVTLALMAEPEGWRAALGVLAASGWLLVGLRLRWQAPVAIGGVALVLQVVVLAGPLGLATLTGVPGWVVLAVTGLVLLTLGLTYERQITTAKATLRRYAELR